MNKNSCSSLAVQSKGAAAVVDWELETVELTATCLNRGTYSLETD